MSFDVMEEGTPCDYCGQLVGFWTTTGRCALLVEPNTSTWILKVAILKPLVHSSTDQ